MTAPDFPGRLLIPQLAVADLAVEFIRHQRPLPTASLEEFRAWSDQITAADARVRALQAKYAPMLCLFCMGFMTIADNPCSMCDATGLSALGRRMFRSHHNGE